VTPHVRLTTLTAVKARIDTALTADDTFLDSLIVEASGWFTRRCRNRSFVPYYDTRSFRYGCTTLSTYGLPALEVDEDLLSVTTFTNADADDTAITAASYTLLPLNGWPKAQIELNADSGVSFEFENGSSALTVAGLWGYHDDYTHAWATASTLAASETDSSTDWAVQTGQGALYSVGSYLLCESEIVRVTAISTDALTVVRAQNGTTAAAHNSATAVKAYQHVRDVQSAVTQLVVFYYQNRDSVESSIQVVDLAIKLESKIPSTVWDTVDAYRKPAFYATSSGY
jgi:hypothetical protein